ncbi:hypothetical protein [Aliivibrio sifiae]|uniref:Uncharacterized protein n=1 Tax=Aliivibrio sifiae TaxID=566293 RepID=A0A2S7XHH3_9GAMM|nr:hypothetical protein [Aliivibrio sifiae]PQJ93159.1 hypothetical protein BTO23_03425 [Aliivibrio sifiae]GLR75995.1 hypothetical protein GCM10007855_28690 [Aliivibrio sifiae]
MNKVQKKSITLHISRIHSEGWWLGNDKEHVAAGTALGSDCTTVIYEPSKKGMTGKFDAINQTWSEVEDKSLNEFFSPVGQFFVIGTPDGDYPDWAVLEVPPEFDPETQTVLYAEKKWTVYPIQIGNSYWNEEGQELLISDFNFTLPEKHTFTRPPKVKKGYAVHLVDGKWKQLEDHREQIAFSKDRDNDEKGDYQVEELGLLPNTHTLLEPEQFDSWNEELGQWQYDPLRYRFVWAQDEKQWQQVKLTKVETELLFYAQDKQIPELYSELRKTHYSEDEYFSLLGDRILLNEYVQQDDFPECGRPTLSGLV